MQRGGTARLEVVHGPPDILGKSFTLQGTRTVIGREAGTDIRIPSDRVSRRHCKLEMGPNGSYALEDLGSSNGTLVNQVRIQGRQLLKAGDYIQTGDCLFRFTP
jgi:pSer/pThr/pTyr-binding forkhead associated (FHA) protein